MIEAIFAVASCVITMILRVGCGGPMATVTFGPTWGGEKIQRVAVLPFSDAKGDPGWNIFVGWATQPQNGEAVASILAEGLIDSGCYKVIERSKFQSILDEYGLSASELIDKKGAKEAGRLLGADAIVMGNVGRYNQVGGLWFFADVSFSARCVDVNTGEVVWSSSPSVQAFGNATEYTKAMCRDIGAAIRQKWKEKHP
jgi:hypothetical protein